MYISTWSDKRDEILSIAEQVKVRHPDAWDEVKVPHQTSRRFINLVSLAGLAAGIPIGVNLKRGGPQQSIDAIALPNATGAMDSTRRYAGLEIVDIVIDAETPDAHLDWGDVTKATLDAGTIGGWQAGTLTQGGVVGTVRAPLQFPPRDKVRDFFNDLNERYRLGLRRNRSLDGEDLYVDNEGLFVWLSEYLRHYVEAGVNGVLEVEGRHAMAVKKVFDDIGDRV